MIKRTGGNITEERCRCSVVLVINIHVQGFILELLVLRLFAFTVCKLFKLCNEET